MENRCWGLALWRFGVRPIRPRCLAVSRVVVCRARRRACFAAVPTRRVLPARLVIQSSSSLDAEPDAWESVSLAARASFVMRLMSLAVRAHAGRSWCSGSVALSLNRQSVRAGRCFSYHGGCTPIDHPLASRAIDVSLRTCQALPGLRGYIGVDLVLTNSEAFVIEVNPRLTTAYLGVRSALKESSGDGPNIAGMAIAACAGHLPEAPPLRRRVRFTSAGRVEAVP
jgi:hypothetical protein